MSHNMRMETVDAEDVGCGGGETRGGAMGLEEAMWSRTRIRARLGFSPWPTRARVLTRDHAPCRTSRASAGDPPDDGTGPTTCSSKPPVSCGATVVANTVHAGEDE